MRITDVSKLPHEVLNELARRTGQFFEIDSALVCETHLAKWVVETDTRRLIDEAVRIVNSDLDDDETSFTE